MQESWTVGDVIYHSMPDPFREEIAVLALKDPNGILH